MNSIFHRISVRKYEDRPVEKEKIMTSRASGKCEGVFYVCTGLSGRDKTSAEPICA